MEAVSSASLPGHVLSSRSSPVYKNVLLPLMTSAILTEVSSPVNTCQCDRGYTKKDLHTLLISPALKHL